MKRFTKWLLLAIGLLVLLLIALVVIATAVIDPDVYKARAAALVEQQTGRELRIPGEVRLTFFPWIGVELGRMELGNAPGFGPEPFGRLERAVVRVAVLPLLRGKVEADTVVVHGLQVRLTRTVDGRTNWEDLAAPAEPARGPAPAPAPADTPPLAALAIGGLEVRNARIDWDDRLNGQQVTVSDLRLQSGRVEAGIAIPLSLEATFANRAPELGGQLTLDAQLTADPGAQVYRVAGLRLTGALRGAPLPSDGLDLDLGLDVLQADLGAGTLTADGLRLAGAGVTLEAEAAVTALLDAPHISGRLRTEEFSPNRLMRRFGVEPPPSADAAALSKARLQAGFDATPAGAALNDLDLRLDDSRLSGSAEVRDFAAPALRFALVLDTIDLDRYLPPPAEPAPAEAPAPPAGAPAPPGAAAGAAAAQLPLETLRGLDLQGTLTVGRLKGFGLRAEQMHAAAAAKNGRIRLHPIGARLYQGTYTGDLSLDVSADVPRLAMDEALSGVQIGPLLRDLRGSEPLTGTAELSARLSARGLEPEAVRKSLAGEARFAFKDGAVKGINIAQVLREAYARYRGQPVPEDTGPRQTDFASITGSLTIADGVARNRDLQAQSPLLRVSGRGTANLAAETVDYTADIVLVKTLEGQGGQALDELRGLVIPLQIKGPLTAPKLQLDVDRVLKAKAREALEEKETELKQRLEQEKQERGKELEQRLKDELKGLFGR